METLEFVNLPISINDFSKLESIVSSANPFLIQPSTITEKYNLKEYVHAASFQDVSLYVLLDNNIFTRVISFSKGEKLATEPESRKVDQLAAAVMVFFLLGDFWIEPNISLYEKAWRNSHEHAKYELENFRIADHIHPQHYADLALGKIDNISPKAIDQAKKNSILSSVKNNDAIEEVNFKKTLTHWKTSYLFLLKATELWRGPNDDFKKAKSLIDWMVNDAFFSGVSSVFSLLLFSPSSPRKMLKGIGSNNKNKLYSGLQNAAWDCVYVKHWINLATHSETDTIWFLCSNDKALKQVASALLHRQGEDMNFKLVQHMKETWGEEKGQKLFNYYNEQVSTLDNSSHVRKQLVKDRMNNIDNMISSLENKLELKSPKSGKD